MRSVLAVLFLAACAPDEPELVFETTPEDSDISTDTPEDTTPVDPPATAVQNAPSGALVPSATPGVVYVADTDNGAILIVDTNTNTTTQVDLGPQTEPTRLFRRDADIWVTLRRSGEVAHLRAEGAGLTLVSRASVGAEPFDITLGAQGTPYVSLSMEEAVVALDPATLAVAHRWSTPQEPRWLTVGADANGADIVFVGTARGANVWQIATSADRVTGLTMPALARNVDESCADSFFQARITGDLTLAADGKSLWVVGMYINTVIDAIPGDEEVDTAFVDDDPTNDSCGVPSFHQPPSSSPYGITVGSHTPAGEGRFNPVLVRIPLVPDVTKRIIALGARMSVNTTDDEPGVGSREIAARSYPTSLQLVDDAVSGDQLALITMESMSGIEVVNLSATTTEDGSLFGAEVRVRTTAQVAAGPTAARSADNTTFYVWSFLDRVVTAVPWVGATSALDAGANTFAVAAGQTPAPTTDLPAAAARGRELFYRSDLRTMARGGSGVSCSTCHPDSRSDGLTWVFPDMDRQTPSLAGRMSTTHPVTWTGEVETVAEEARLTVELRMGGLGVTPEQAADIAAFVDWSRVPVLPQPTDGALVEQGRQIFRRPEVGCAACHANERGTSAVVVPLFGEDALSVPPLEGIAATPPYFHDGSAPTLRDVLLRARDGAMGNTGSLSDQEMTALEAYLRHFGQ